MFEEQKERIIVECISPHLSELNPIGTCWKVTKNKALKSHYFKKIDKLQDALE